MNVDVIAGLGKTCRVRPVLQLTRQSLSRSGARYARGQHGNHGQRLVVVKAKDQRSRFVEGLQAVNRQVQGGFTALLLNFAAPVAGVTRLH